MSRRKERRQRFERIRETFARDAGLPFGRLLSREYVLGVLDDLGLQYRTRAYCPLVTLWGMLSQALSQDKSLNEVVSRIVAHRVANGLPAISADSGAYSRARSRFPLEAMARMARETGRKIHDSRDTAWDWRGRPVYLCDGTGLSMADTVENQLAYPQSKQQKPGLGFPVMRAVGLISLATGAVVDFAFAPERGKGTGESALLRRLMGSLSPGDVLVADKYFPSFFTVAMLLEQGVDLVSVSHAGRTVDFDSGIVPGERDHIAAWHRPQRPEWMDIQTYERMPETIQVREFCIEIDGRDGGKEAAIVVSTVTDPSVPQKDLSDLYWQRWNCEVDLRSIKHTLHLDVIRAKSPSMVQKEVWSHLLAWNLLRGVMTETAKRHDVLPRHLSLKRTVQAVESFTGPMMVINEPETVYNAFLTTVATHRVGNRPGRAEPRFKKRRPAWKAYMTISRHESKRRLASEARAARVALS